MIRSMTGFGTADGRVGAARVTVEVRTVNHRFFNPSLKLPTPLARWETEVREALRQRVARGHVTLSARVEREANEERPGLQIDEARFAGYVGQLRELAARHGLSDALDVATVLRLPDVLIADASPEPEGSADELLAIVARATDALTTMREDEGRRLADDLEGRIAAIEDALNAIAELAPARLTAERDRLRAAIAELSGGVAVNEDRLAQEIAHLAERWDINEELVRFRSHNELFRELMAADAVEPVGKRLSFLVQEMHREANTIGSKANHAGIAHRVIAIKEEVERLREQVENVE